MKEVEARQVPQHGCLWESSGRVPEGGEIDLNGGREALLSRRHEGLKV